MATVMPSLGVEALTVERVLNHRLPATLGAVASVYNRHAYLDEQRTALNAWAAHVASLQDDSG